MTISLVPLPCTILAIGPESKRGWSVHRGHEVIDSGTAETPLDRMRAVETAQKASKNHQLIVVMERWCPEWNVDSILFGILVGRWLEVLELAGHSEDKMVFVHPLDWRKQIPDDDAICTKVAQDFNITANFDVAGSILIGKWAIYADDVREVMPRISRRLYSAWIPKLYESNG